MGRETCFVMGAPAMKRDIWVVTFGLLAGLLIGGLLYLASAPPRGLPVQLLPPPTPVPLQVYISGGVAQPGIYSLPLDSRVQDAIDAAGGVLPQAALSAINPAAPVKDGERLDIPVLAPTAPPQAVSAAPAAIQAAAQVSQPQVIPTAAVLPAEPGKVNINTAGLEELDTLPGVGPVTAQKIIDYRQANGPFLTIEAIMDVSGIGPATFARMQDLITIGTTP
jgi:competence protein ComEA